MRILVTNDDGIGGEGLKVLAAWAKNIGEVTVVAPKFEQSAKSQSLRLRDAFEVKRSDIFASDGIESYSVDSTPADCVRFAIDKLEKFDIVLSGINRGLNLGYDILYSGTCAAAFEANYAKIPAIAFSTVPDQFKSAASALDGIWEYFKKRDLLSYCSIYNVNIPSSPTGIVITGQGGAYFRDHFDETENNMYKAMPFVAYTKGDPPNLKIDTDAVFSGYISVMPMTVNRADSDAVLKLM